MRSSVTPFLSNLIEQVSQLSWEKPAKKFEARAYEARKLGNGKCTGIVSCNIYSYSTLAFVAQIREPPQDLCKKADHLNRILLGGPYRWMPDELIPMMQSHMSLPCAPYSLEILCKAIRLRFICSNSVPWAGECLRLSRIPAIDPRNDPSPLQSLGGTDDWLPRLTCKILEQTANEGRRLGIIRFDADSQLWKPCRELLPFSGRKVQSVEKLFIQELLLPRWGSPSILNPCIIRALHPRVKRWQNVADTSMQDTKRVLALLSENKSVVSPNVAFGFIQSICYGWNTDKRHRNFPIRGCVFGCSDTSGCDDFYHYYCCEVVQNACSRLGLDFVPVGDSLLRHLLVLDGPAQCPLRMTFLHAVMSSLHQLRSGHSHVLPCNRGRHIEGIYRETVSRNPKLRKLFNEIQ